MSTSDLAGQHRVAGGGRAAPEWRRVWAALVGGLALLTACTASDVLYEQRAPDAGWSVGDTAGDDEAGGAVPLSSGGTRVGVQDVPAGGADAGYVSADGDARELAESDGVGVGDDGEDPPPDGIALDGPADAGEPAPDTGGDEDRPLSSSVVVEERLVDDDADGWARVERCWVEHPGLLPERFVAKTRQSDEAILRAFDGEAAPAPERFLLHFHAGWDTASGPPVLLVHGAGSHATQSFLRPDVLGREPGLAPSLADAGVPVFAVTFSARYGDNGNQAIVIAAALQRVRDETGAAQVDVVAHSKGGLAAVAYIGGMLAARGTPYAGDVDRLVLLGVPLGGMDFSFRHPAFNYAAAGWGYELPTSWDEMLLWGLWQDVTDESIYGGAYDGLLQSLARWDDVHGLSLAEQDWYTTYEGGRGFVSHSLGIDAAVEMGDHFVARMRAAPLPGALEVALLVGTSAWVGLTLWEATGPSDGLIFTRSAGDGAWVAGAGATLLGVHELRVNHWELLHDRVAREQVLALLR